MRTGSCTNRAQNVKYERFHDIWRVGWIGKKSNFTFWKRFSLTMVLYSMLINIRPSFFEKYKILLVSFSLLFFRFPNFFLAYFRHYFWKEKFWISEKLCVKYGASFNSIQHLPFHFRNLGFLLISWHVEYCMFLSFSVVCRQCSSE